MNDVVLFLADGFEEIEAVTPADYMRRAGISVVTASCSGRLLVTGSHGIPVQADIMAEEAFSIPHPDGVVVPGGMPGAANIASCTAAMGLLSRVWQQGGVVAAICAAPVVALSRLGILAGKKYTCYPEIDQEMPRWAGDGWRELTEGSVKQDNRVVADGRLVTACGPGAAEEFALELVRIIAGEKIAGDITAASCLRP